MNHGALLGRRIAFFGAHRGVVRRVARKRRQHGEVILHAIHFGAHQVPVYLFRHAPAGGIDGAQLRLQGAQGGKPARVGGRGVIGNPVAARRLLEGAPFSEQRQQLGIATARRGRLRVKQGLRHHEQGHQRGGHGGGHGNGAPNGAKAEKRHVQMYA